MLGDIRYLLLGHRRDAEDWARRRGLKRSDVIAGYDAAVLRQGFRGPIVVIYLDSWPLIKDDQRGEMRHHVKVMKAQDVIVPYPTLKWIVKHHHDAGEPHGAHLRMSADTVAAFKATVPAPPPRPPWASLLVGPPGLVLVVDASVEPGEWLLVDNRTEEVLLVGKVEYPTGDAHD